MLKSTHQLAAVAALSWCTLPAFGAEPAPRPEGQSVFQVMPAPTDNVSGENRVMFASPGDASDAMNAMRRRLADPAQRAVVRSEQRAVMQGLYQDLEEALQIDGSTASRLLDALTDQEMDRQDAYATEFPDLQERADTENRRLDELFVILGERGAERFQDYTATLGPRR